MRIWLVYLTCFLGLGVLAAVWNSDAIKKQRNPQHYWSNEVRVQSELLADYKRQVTECRLELRNLATREAAKTWVAQRALEGFTREEALADYKSSLEISKTVCQMFARIQQDTDKALVEAQRQLELANE